MLGLPLARPLRRLAAMAIDGILVAILVKSGATFLGLSAALVLFRASRRDAKEGSVFKRSVRMGLRIVGAVVLFIVVAKGFVNLQDRFTGKNVKDEVAQTQDTNDSDDDAGDDLKLDIPPGRAGEFASALMAVRSADDSAEVFNAVTRVMKLAKEAGATSQQMHDRRPAMIKLMGDDADEKRIAGLDAVLIQFAGAGADSVALQTDTLREELHQLRKTNDDLSKRNEKLKNDLEKAEKPHGFRSFLTNALDDLGVGFGWLAVYFTAFLAMWRGQTPGKRLFRIRVMRLDGQPLGWWMSFERFGGYAASASVGLLGFAQILWDRNRQGLHDKACETVVIREAPKTKSLS